MHKVLTNKISLTEMNCQLHKIEKQHNQTTHNQTTHNQTTESKH